MVGKPNNVKSQHRVVLAVPNSKPFGTLLNQSAIRTALQTYGSIWSVDFRDDGGLCFVTLKDAEAVETLVGAGELTIASMRVKTSYLKFDMSTSVSIQMRGRPPS